MAERQGAGREAALAAALHAAAAYVFQEIRDHDPAAAVLPAEVAPRAGDGRPDLALESTIITPTGCRGRRTMQTAREVEAEVRAAGAVPATMAVMACGSMSGLKAMSWNAGSGAGCGQAVGAPIRPPVLPLARRGHHRCRNHDLRPLAVIDVFGQPRHRRCASRRRKAASTSRRPAGTGADAVTVVAAGAKGEILDLPKTLEVLETYGVPVIAFGQMSFRPSGRAPRASRRRCGWIRRRRLRRRTDARALWACRAGSWWQTPIPVGGRNPARRDRPGDRTALAEAAAQGIARQGSDDLPACRGSSR